MSLRGLVFPGLVGVMLIMLRLLVTLTQRLSWTIQTLIRFLWLSRLAKQVTHAGFLLSQSDSG